MFCDRDEKMMVENARAARWSVAAHEDAQQRTETTPLMNEAHLNCVALRSHRASMPTSENKLIKEAATSALTFMTFS